MIGLLPPLEGRKALPPIPQTLTPLTQGLRKADSAALRLKALPSQRRPATASEGAASHSLFGWHGLREEKMEVLMACLRRILGSASAPSGCFYDLGCGDGRVVVEVCHKLGVRGVGMDLQPLLVNKARRLAKQRRLGSRATFSVADLRSVDLSNAAVVFFYFPPHVATTLLNAALRKSKLRAGTVIISADGALQEGVRDGTLQPVRHCFGSCDVYCYTWRGLSPPAAAGAAPLRCRTAEARSRSGLRAGLVKVAAGEPL